MATKTPVDSVTLELAQRWSGFVNKYASFGLNEVHDQASWDKWVSRMQREHNVIVSNKYWEQYRTAYEKASANQPASPKPITITVNPTPKGTNALAVSRPVTASPTGFNPSDGERIANATGGATPPPSDPRDKERKEAARKIVKRFFKQNHVNYRPALLDKYMPTDPRYKAIEKELETEWTTRYDPMNRKRTTVTGQAGYTVALDEYRNGSIGDPHARTLKNDARERFLRYHTGATDDYYKKERGVLHQSVGEDSMKKTTDNQLLSSVAVLTHPENSYYQNALSYLDSKEVLAIGKKEYTRQFVQTFPEKATAYAQEDPEIQAALTDETLDDMEEEEQEPTTLPPLRAPSLIPSMGASAEEESNERDIGRSNTRDERQDQANQASSPPPQSPRDRPNPFSNAGDKAKNAVKNKLNQGKDAVKKAGKDALKKGAKKLIKEGAKKVIQEGLKDTAPYWLPWVAGGVAAIIGILIIIGIIVIITGGLKDEQDKNKDANNPAPITVTKTVNKTEMKNPSELSDGEKTLTYQFTTTYGGKAARLETVEVLPDGLTFIEASGTFTAYDAANAVISNPNEQKGLVKKIVWSTGATPTASVSGTVTPSQTGSITAATYTQPPYSLPTPSGNSDITYTSETISRLNTLGSTIAAHQDYLKTKVKGSDGKYVDPFLSVIWAGAIEGTGGNPYSWNCSVYNPGTINQGCAGGFTSGGWQVGPGIQVAQTTDHLVADFIEVYGGDTVEKVKDVGQKVIDNSSAVKGGKITNPSTFPNETIASLISKANSGDVASQQAIAIILMDPQISGIVVAQEIAGDIASADNWRKTMEGWGSYYVSNMQQFSNRMQSLATSYTGTGVGSSGTIFPVQSYTLTVTVNDDVKDTYIINQATASVIGAETKTGSGTTSTASNPNATTFFDLMKGQGRNTAVLGDENAFVTAVSKNGSSRFGGNVSSDNLHALYQKAIAKNVNPLIILTIWGIEQSFTSQDPMFGCLGFPAGFPDQMSCAVNSINNHMAFFEEEEKKGRIPYVVTLTDPETNVVHSCSFTDAFEYAYERYTPVCLMDDGNGNSRKNFVAIYKELLGVK